MLPLLYISQPDHWEALAQNLAVTYSLSPTSITTIEPEKNELTISQMRTMIKDISYARNKPHMFVIHSFDSASSEVQNALLKTVEEPPENVFIVLFAQQIHTVLPTILSRVTVRRESETKGEMKYQLTVNAIFSADSYGKALGIDEINKIDVKQAQELSRELIAEGRMRMMQGTFSPTALKTLLDLRNLLLSNNLNPQLAIDNMVLEIIRQRT